MEANTPMKSADDMNSMTSNGFEAEDYENENLMASNSQEIYYMNPTVNSTEFISDRIGFSPIFGLGLILIALVILSLCNAIYRRLNNDVDVRRDPNIQRTTPNQPSTPVRFLTERVIQNTSPKRISPRAVMSPPAGVHLSTTPKRTRERASAESLETFEPWTSYRYIHPDIPNELIGPRSSTSTPESEIMSLQERISEMPDPFTDGVTRRKLSFQESGLDAISDPEDLASRRSSTIKDA